jgi:two-component system, chemotaxis family, CheB/CheR fusion protein
MVRSNKKKTHEDEPGFQDTDQSFPIVMLGSSAGGLEANEVFFKSAPADSDMAFIVITHLEPHHPSLLAEIISKSTTMETVQAQNDMAVQKNKVYVIPPGKEMIITSGILRLFGRKNGHEPFMPIDFFLRSLAEDRRENAIAVILSGNGSDGSLGIKAIHTNLGMVMVQSPETAKYDSMPRSAIGTGLVDYVLPPSEMPGMINKYVLAFRARKKLPRIEPVGSTHAVQKMLSIVKSETGHDFSHYKKSTINRRIERRMSVNQIESDEQYVSYLLANPQEIHLLFKELMIEVTSFFRNPKAFESLKENLKEAYFAPKSDKDSLRVWVTPCSTGEEVYSIAIVLKELMDETGQIKQVQIFGSDINDEAIEIARAGDYPSAIADDVDAMRLGRFFIKQQNNYKVKKEIREMVIFASHDIISDTPFLHLDLISCRNLLIYFEPVLQRRVLEMFSNALNPSGILFLGESETINGFEEKFTTIDSRWKNYRRNPYTPAPRAREIAPPPQRVKEVIIMESGMTKKPNLDEKVEKILLSHHTPPSLVVNEKNEIVYFHGRTSKYLEHTPGRASLDIRDLLREDIRYAVISAISACGNNGKTVVKEAIRVHTNGNASFLNIIVKPLDDHQPTSDVLVIFDEKTIPQDILREKQDLNISPNKELRIDELEKELNYTKENLRITIEQLETSNEELTSTNEELQSNNEELQSVAEESETGKEELNSLNEELLTVNSELERKNRELSRTYSDMRNLLNSVDEATIFLDIDLRIRRFTPQTEKIMNLLPRDVGRPIHDIAMNLRYEDLLIDFKEVLDTLNTKEKEVQTKNGRWYKLKILPYRTVENVIDGVVITFSDIQEQKQVQEVLKEVTMNAQASQEYAESIVNTIKEPLLILDKDLIVQSSNTSFNEQFEVTSSDIKGLPLCEILGGAWNISHLLRRLDDLSSNDEELENIRAEITVHKLGTRSMVITARKLVIPSGKSTMMLVNIKME